MAYYTFCPKHIYQTGVIISMSLSQVLTRCPSLLKGISSYTFKGESLSSRRRHVSLTFTMHCSEITIVMQSVSISVENSPPMKKGVEIAQIGFIMCKVVQVKTNIYIINIALGLYITKKLLIERKKWNNDYNEHIIGCHYCNSNLSGICVKYEFDLDHPF